MFFALYEFFNKIEELEKIIIKQFEEKYTSSSFINTATDINTEINLELTNI